MGRFKKLLSFALAVLLLSALPLSSALAEGGADGWRPDLGPTRGK